MKTKPWKTEPINCTCEVVIYDLALQPSAICDKPTVAAYRARCGGWQALCCEHAQPHNEAVSTDILIASGETWR